MFGKAILFGLCYLYLAALALAVPFPTPGTGASATAPYFIPPGGSASFVVGEVVGMGVHPSHEHFVIIRGRMTSSPTSGTRSGFFLCLIEPGDTTTFDALTVAKGNAWDANVGLPVEINCGPGSSHGIGHITRLFKPTGGPTSGPSTSSGPTSGPSTGPGPTPEQRKKYGAGEAKDSNKWLDPQGPWQADEADATYGIWIQPSETSDECAARVNRLYYKYWQVSVPSHQIFPSGERKLDIEPSNGELYKRYQHYCGEKHYND